MLQLTHKQYMQAENKYPHCVRKLRILGLFHPQAHVPHASLGEESQTNQLL